VVRRALVLLAVPLLVLLAPGVASATSPLNVGNRITDRVGALTPHLSDVERSLAELDAATGVHLYAVFVPSFGTTAPDRWAAETAQRSGLGSTDLMLTVAVADGSYEYDWWLGGTFPLSDQDVEAVITHDVEPAMNAGDWAPAVTALADHIRTEMTAAGLDVSMFAPPRWTRSTTLVIAGGTLTALLAGHVLSRRRSSAAAG
jgi:uncharacterized membrane protein YgcG